jgi:hypothetical protein
VLFSVLSRRFLKRGDFAGVAGFEQRLRAFLEEYNVCHAHPYRWTTPVSRWCVARRLRRPDGSNSADVPGLADGPAGKDACIRRDRISGQWPDWRDTYKTII